ncbi:MAG: aldo/keto reductase [Pseudomonadota bacterium]
MTRMDIERTVLGEGLSITRILTGLWQVADIEKDGHTIDPETGADALEAYVNAGFDTFDMADHYGSAEIIAGRLLDRVRDDRRPVVCTKWCPPPGPMSDDTVRAGVAERLRRLGAERVDLLQFHWWRFDHPAWLDALHGLARLRDEGLIAELGVTNFDAAHLQLALSDGIPIASNQVAFSLIDRRASGPLSEVASRWGVGLLAYGTLGGGFLSERWLHAEDPTALSDWSKMKYRRFIEAAGGWPAFQAVLCAAAEVAARHGVSISNVASRWVLEQPRVAGVIIGARLGEANHSASNARLFDFALDKDDHACLDEAFARTKMVPGDCGDEYRKPPFLTASGDLSHHLDAPLAGAKASQTPHRSNGARVLSGTYWEDAAGYCRAQRIGDRILVSGTTATSGADRVVAPGDAGAQATYILDKIASALAALGASLEDVIRTRIYLIDPADVDAVAAAHGRVFAEIKPANTLVVVAKLIGDYAVEIEAEAMLRLKPEVRQEQET